MEKVTENMTLHMIKTFALQTINRFCYDNNQRPKVLYCNGFRAVSFSWRTTFVPFLLSYRIFCCGF